MPSKYEEKTIAAIERAVRAKKRGTAKSIAARLGVGVDSVTRRARAAGRPFYSRRRTAEDLAAVAEDVLEGRSRGDTAKLLGASQKRITRLRGELRRAGKLPPSPYAHAGRGPRSRRARG